MTTPDIARVKEVFEQRSMYDAVVRGNYMHHAELIAALGAWAAEFERPLRIVDLGCGDASLASTAFHAANVAYYCGIELAEASASAARRNVQIWSDRAEILCGNLADTIARLPDASANAVLASYSLHHFSTSDKLKLVREIRRLLEPGGALLWIDAVRTDNESRDAYINRLNHAMLHDWTGLTLDERKRGVEHVQTSDFPETKSWMLANLIAAGFRLDGTLLASEFFDGWVFTKA